MMTEFLRDVEVPKEHSSSTSDYDDLVKMQIAAQMVTWQR